MGAATKCAIPGCFAAASAASVGMSSCQCLPGERKNGLTATVVAPIASISDGDQKYEFGNINELDEIRKQLLRVQFGEMEDKHGWMREVSL